MSTGSGAIQRAGHPNMISSVWKLSSLRNKRKKQTGPARSLGRKSQTITSFFYVKLLWGSTGVGPYPVIQDGYTCRKNKD